MPMVLSKDVLKTVYALAKEYVNIVITEIKAKVSRDADTREAMERLFSKQALIAERVSNYGVQPGVHSQACSTSLRPDHLREQEEPDA